jgi:threonyl-tRNA synthetase
MRLLLIHSDYLEYEAREKAIPQAEDDLPLRGRRDEVLVCFVAVESSDEGVADRASSQIADVASKVKAERIALYPYAHLSSDLGPPDLAISVLRETESLLKEKGYDVYRVPFGWYKSFKLSCKGHALSELSRSVYPRREEVVEKVESRYIILYPDGREVELDEGSEIEEESLRKVYLGEVLGKWVGKEPPSIKGMVRLELVDREPASDSGHFRFYPKGLVVFRSIEEWSRDFARSIGAIEIETPIMYDWSLPDIREQTISFQQRHYTVTGGDSPRKFVLRFAGDFGLFRMLSDFALSYRQLPLRVFEFSKSFRYEQSGELSGLRRLRGFHMPDVHCFVKDLEEGWEEYRYLYEKYEDLAKSSDVEHCTVFHSIEDFYRDNRDKILKLLEYTGKPALVELLSERRHYWVIKHEIQGIDSVGSNCQLSTVQLDLEDAARYGITYIGEDGKQRGCVILHSSIGSVERWIYMFLEEAYKKQKPYLPFWISPVQVRLIPVKPEYVEDCKELADELGGRVDIDDRELTVGKRIREAEKEWVNLILVIGEEERSGRYKVRDREEGRIKIMSRDELMREIKSKEGDYPKVRSNFPLLMSRRINFD